MQSGGFSNYGPHPDNVTYTEKYRGQYHFSPKSEWMNDINALMYFDGQHHMIYQWGKKIRHGGYATSPDLLHWTDQGLKSEKVGQSEDKRVLSNRKCFISLANSYI